MDEQQHGNFHFGEHDVTLLRKRGGFSLTLVGLQYAHKLLNFTEWRQLERELQAVIRKHINMHRREICKLMLKSHPGNEFFAKEIERLDESIKAMREQEGT